MNTGLDPRRPALAGKLGELWAGQREPEPARLRRHARLSPAHGGRRPAELGHGIHAGRVSRDAARAAGRADRQPATRRPSSAPDRQRGKLDFLDRLNRRHLPIAASIKPSSTPESRAMSWRSGCKPRHPRRSIWRARPTRRARSTAWTTKATESSAGICLLARRLVERGVRFVQIYCGAGEQVGRPRRTSKGTTPGTAWPWTSRSRACSKTSRAAGLLDETLVVWGGEFGRTPMSEKGDGRDHNPYGFTMWMAGGGVKAGIVDRQDRRGRPARHRRPAARPRHPRHDPPLPGRRPLQAHLSPPGPPRTAHRQRGAGL